jgi:hypothetical protein
MLPRETVRHDHSTPAGAALFPACDHPDAATVATVTLVPPTTLAGASLASVNVGSGLLVRTRSVIVELPSTKGGAAASKKSPGQNASERLLWDCATIGRVIELDRPLAAERLAAEVGSDLAAILLRREPPPAARREQSRPTNGRSASG